MSNAPISNPTQFTFIVYFQQTETALGPALFCNVVARERGMADRSCSSLLHTS